MMRTDHRIFVRAWALAVLVFAFIGWAADAVRGQETPEEERLRRLEQVGKLEEAGRFAEAAEIWEPAAREWDGWEPLILLGDLEWRAGNAMAAREAYFAAERESPDAAVVHRRILVTFRAGPAGERELPEQWRWCERLRHRHLPDLAIECLELWLHRTGDIVQKGNIVQNDASVHDEAVVGWTDLALRRGRLGPEDLERLPADPGGAGIEELARLVAAPAASTEPEAGYVFWTESVFRRYLVAEILRLRAQVVASNGEGGSVGPEALLRSAGLWAPTPEEQDRTEELKERSTVWVDVRTDLAALHHRAGQEEELAALAQKLLDNDEAETLGRDLGTLHRFHTVFGVILTERQDLDLDVGRRGDAVYQLNRAIDTAGELATTQHRPPAPQPDLHHYLGRAYSPELRALGLDFGVVGRVVGRLRKSGEAFFQASQGYLDLDDLGSAGQALERARGPRNLWTGPDTEALEAVLELRRAVRRDEVAPDRLLRDLRDESGWLGGAASTDLPAPFLLRQRYKTVAEMLRRMDESPTDESLEPVRRRLASHAAALGSELEQSGAYFDAFDREHLSRFEDGLLAACGPGGALTRTADGTPQIGSCSARIVAWRDPDLGFATESGPSREGETFCVCGNFPRAQHRNGLLFDGRPLGAPLAATGSSLVFSLPPGVGPGLHAISGSAAAGFDPEGKASLRVLELRQELDEERLRKIGTATLTVSVEGTSDPVSVRLANATPGVVSLTGGDRQILRTSGGTTNRASLAVRAPCSHATGGCPSRLEYRIHLTAAGSRWSCGEEF